MAGTYAARMTDELLQAYDDQLRREGEVGTAEDLVLNGPLMWAVFDHGGFVTYRDLGGLEGADLDALIEETVDHFRDDTEVGAFEWKSRGHDLPADLGDRLVAHGFEAPPAPPSLIPLVDGGSKSIFRLMDTRRPSAVQSYADGG